MTATTKTAPKKARSLCWKPYALGYGLLTITEQVTKTRTETVAYIVAPLEAAYGRGFRVLKAVADTADDTGDYDVHLDADGTASCECKGFLRWSKCRHVEAVRKLIELGKL